MATWSISEPFLRPGYLVESPAGHLTGRTLAFLSAEGGNQTPYVVTPGSSEPRSIAPASGWGAISRMDGRQPIPAATTRRRRPRVLDQRRSKGDHRSA